MKPSQMDEKYSTREVIKIVSRIGPGTRDFDNDRLKEWQRRPNTVPGEPTGKGNERQYSFDDLVFIASLALLANRSRYLSVAIEAAQEHAVAVISMYATGPDGYAVDSLPPQLIIFSSGDWTACTLDPKAKLSSIAKRYASHGAVLTHPGQFAMDLSARVSDVLAERTP